MITKRVLKPGSIVLLNSKGSMSEGALEAASKSIYNELAAMGVKLVIVPNNWDVEIWEKPDA